LFSCAFVCEPVPGLMPWALPSEIGSFLTKSERDGLSLNSMKSARRTPKSVLDRALERYRRERFLRAANADFAALKQDAKSWTQELRERELWEQTLEDGTVSWGHMGS
jgi:hypothetical protein